MRLSFKPAALLSLVLVVGIGTFGRAAAQGSDDPLVTLPGNTPAAVAKATPAQGAQANAAASTDDQPITITIVLNRSDPAGFNAFVKSVEDPNSSQYQQFLSQDELTARFGPSPFVYDAVIKYLKLFGFNLIAGSDNRLTVTVQGTRAQAEKAFNVVLHDYKLGSRSFFANDRDPAVPQSVAPFIQSIDGLSDLARPHRAPTPKETVANASGAPTPAAASSIATAYNAAGLGGVTGTGQKIGLVEFSSFNPSNVSTLLSTLGLPASLIGQMSTVNVNGGTTDMSGEDEVLLDIDAALEMAPGAHTVAYIAPNAGTSWPTMLNAMINDGDTVISNSWDSCETDESASSVASIDSIIASASASGVSVFTAAGDTGNQCSSSDPAGSIGVPADTAHGVAVGGTSLSVGNLNAYGGEAYWVDSNGNPAGGFGVSKFQSRPSWQSSFNGSSFRSIPDVSADANPGTGILVCDSTNGCNYLWGGTSLAAPIWASGIALINQKLGHQTGNLNPALYAAANTSAFHNAASMHSDFAHVGLGSFNLGNLATALAGGSSGGGSTAPGTVQQSSPANGATGQSTTPTLSWTAPSGAVSGTTQYTVSIRQGSGTGTALADLPATTGLSTAVPASEGLAAGQTYAWNVKACNGSACSSLNATWYTFATQASGGTGGATKAAITSPTPGSTLSGTSVTFSWSAVSGASSYYLYVGTQGAGSANLLNASQGTNTSTTVNNLPTSGTIYVRLWTSINGGWQYNDYTYTGGGSSGGTSGGGTTATITSPTPGSTLSGTSATFTWSAVSGASSYYLYVGTQGAGSANLLNASQGTNTQTTVSTLPANGSTIYVRLWTSLNGGWTYQDYTYISAQ